MKLHTLVAAAIVSFSMTAHATIPEFETLDADGNGLISKQEAARSEAVMASFAAADLDKDGSLSVEEYTALR